MLHPEPRLERNWIGAHPDVTGTGLAGTTSVAFGGTVASFSVISDNLVAAVSPASGPGVVDVRITNSAGTSPAVAGDAYTYT